MPYKLSYAAETDLIHIYLEGVRLFGTKQAETYHAKLEHVFEILADNPKIAPERTEFTPTVRIHSFISHIIIYVADSDSITILRIRHAKEDWISETEIKT